MMANPNYYLDDMDSCEVHGIGSMRFTPPEDRPTAPNNLRNLDNWACSQCGFNAGDIDWWAKISKEQG